MSIRKNNLENSIREYLLDEGILREKLSSSDLDFGFIFSFPQGPNSQNMSVIKPKNKNCIFTIIKTQISKKHANTLNSFKGNKKFLFFNTLRKYFLAKEVYFKIDVKNFIIEIIKQIFPDMDGNISKNTFFNAIQKVFYCYAYSNLLIEEYCLKEDISHTEFGHEFDFSLYS
ncbi:MAG: DUF2299 domain-containing protein [Promethearchaeota archaeon]|nr:MAG: DUF2299 domain-containing protein [Candidatus Lokiarchaeota archaeon]